MTDQRMVYVVTRGQFSAYRILGVYDDKARAERVADLMSEAGYGNAASVEEWPLNDPPEGMYPPGMLAWSVTVGDDGETTARRMAADDDDLNGPPFRLYSGWELTVWAPDAEAAGKIAQDRLAAHRVRQVEIE